MMSNEDIIDKPLQNDKLKGNKIEEKLIRYNISKKITLFTLILSITVDIFGFTLIIPLLPGIVESFGQGAIVYGIAVASNAIASLIFGPIWGKLSDKYGRKPILMINQLGTIGAFFLLAFSTNIEFIIFSRIIDGAFGGQFPIIQAIVADVSDIETRTKDFSKVLTSSMSASFLGPIVGGILGAINWRYPAFLTVGLGVISVFLTIFVLKESMPKKRRYDLKLKRTSIHGTSNLTLRKFLTPVVRLRLIQGFIISMVFQFFFATLPLIMLYRYNASEIETGIIMSLFFIINAILMGPVLHVLVDRYNSLKILLFGVSGLLIAMVLYGIASERWVIYAFLIQYVAGVAFTRPITRTNLSKAVDEDQQGRVSGLAIFLRSLAQIITPLFLSAIIQYGDFQFFSFIIEPYWIIGGFGVIIVIALLLLLLYDKKKFGL
jgi:DHA1 family tetracycline resistance protein-like MFS transporter